MGRGRAVHVWVPRWHNLVSTVVLAFVAAVFVVGAAVSFHIHDVNEQRLLQRQTDEAATLLVASIAGVELPLLAAARAAVASDGDEARFVELVSPFVGETSQLARAFSDLDYAVYLGEDERRDALLGSSLADLPIDGRRATATAPFGDDQVLLVTTPMGSLGSGLLANLWWIVLLVGACVTTAAASLVRQLHRRRDRAVELANENEGLFRQQRDIAETLQFALLPQRLVGPPGSEVASRYWPAASAALIGGDLFDAFRIDENRWGIVIGDVCGHGTEAAALTGLVRHTLRGVARYSYSPAEVLGSVHEAFSEHQPNTFCTVCFITFTADGTGGGELVVALGGHPQPLIRRRNGAVEAIGVPGTVLGMVEPTLVDVGVNVAPGDTLMLYTDGLTDAPRDEAVPMSEIEAMLIDKGDIEVGALADSIRTLKRRRRPKGSSDDTAMLIIRFGSPGAGAGQMFAGRTHGEEGGI